jgi:hypothetical protein
VCVFSEEEKKKKKLYTNLEMQNNFFKEKDDFQKIKG